MAQKPNIAKTNLDSRTKYMFLKLGQITRIDYESLSADVEILDGNGARSEIPLTQAMMGARSFLGGIPEEGSVVILGWKRWVENQATPLILGYLPKGYLSQVNFDPTSLVDPNGDSPIESFPEVLGVRRSKYRKIYPGNILASSSQGSDTIWDRNIRMFDSSGGSLILNSHTHSVDINTLNVNQVLASGLHYSGVTARNKLLFVNDIFNEDGSVNQALPAFNILQSWGWIDEAGFLLPQALISSAYPKTILPNGKPYYVVPGPGEFNKAYDQQIFSYVEDRLEVLHTSDGIIPVTESTDGAEVDKRYPLIERVYGTYVGNSIYSDVDRLAYGQVCRPILFTGNNDAPGSVFPSLQPCNRETDNEDERNAAAYLYRLNRPGNITQGIFIAHDKQGHGYYHFPASSASHPLGAGKSVSLNTNGNIKALVGRDPNGISLDLATSGSLNLTPGKDNAGSSLNLNIPGYAVINATGADSNGFSYRLVSAGVASETCNGKVLNVFGSSIDAVSGTKDERYNKLTTKVINDNATFIGAGSSVTVKGKVDASYGGIAETIMVGDFERTSKAGKCKTTLTAGDFIVSITAGNVSDEIVSGNRETTITTGDFKVVVTSGNISLNTKQGNIDIKTLSGSITIDGMTQVTVKSSVKVIIDAPMVDIGKVLAGGVVCGTGPSNPGGHLDYMTGSPLMGSPTVKV